MQAQTKQPRVPRRVLGAAIVLAVGVIIGLVLWVRTTSGAMGSSTQASALTRTNEGGQITIKVTWQGKQAGPVFLVEMDTHAVDLDGYDLRQLAILRTDQGQQVQPSAWNAPAGGHHRSGTLSFPTTTASGKPIIGPTTRTMTLTLRNVGSVTERVFTWTL